MTTLPPIRREVVVSATPDVAFTAFTTRIGAWWPIADLSVHGDGGTVAFVDGRIVETGPAGDTSVWGTVNAWQPPSTVGFSWHPGKEADRASAVTVTFTEVEDGTLVVLEHTGWEVFDDPAVAREEYFQGWPAVLAAYVADTSGASPR